MKALSILQPWAWLIAHGHKDIENRTWINRYHGPFLIHAGKRWGNEQLDDCAHIRDRFPHIILPANFDLGGLVGIAEADGCITRSTSPWFNGPFGIPVTNARPIPFAPYRGQLGWFDVPDGLIWQRDLDPASSTPQGSLL